MWTNDVNIELVHKAPIQLMNEAGLVIAAPARIRRCQDQELLATGSGLTRLSHRYAR
jgi:hypothetical protein